MPHGYVFVHLCYTSRDDWCNVGCVYAYRREASRCSFRRHGQCESLQLWSEQQVTGFTLFYIVNGTIMCHMRPVVHIKIFKHNETCEEILSKERPPHDGYGHGYGIRFV